MSDHGLSRAQRDYDNQQPPPGTYYCDACRKRDRLTEITEDEAEAGLCAECLAQRVTTTTTREVVE